MDNLTLTLLLCLATFVGACLFVLGVRIGAKYSSILTWALAFCLILWGVVLVGVALLNIFKLWII